MSSYGVSRPAKSSIIVADGEPLDLRNRALAAFLAWLLPGAGHFYQRRYLKSTIFFIAIMSTFGLGMLVSGGRCVYAAWGDRNQPAQAFRITRLPSMLRTLLQNGDGKFILQAGVGLPALPAAYQAYRISKGQVPILNGFMAPPASPAVLSDWNAETSSGFDMGTLYTMIAGLLNVLVIFDAWGGPLPPPAKTKPPEEELKEATANG